MRRHNAWANWLARLLIVSLVIQTGAMAWHATAIAGEHQLEAVPGARTIVICASGGLVEITIDEDGNPIAPIDHADPAVVCPVCTLQANTIGLLPPAPVLVTWSARSYRVAYTCTFEGISDRSPLVRRGHDPPTPS